MAKTWEKLQNVEVESLRTAALLVGAPGSEVQLTATPAELNLLDGLTATTTEIIQGCDLSTQVVMAPGAGFAGTGTLYKASVIKHGDVIKTEIIIDLTGAASSTTDLDIIGTSGVSHIGQFTALKNGTCMGGKMTCLEVPTGGVVDIDLYAATEGTGAFDGGIGALVETALVTAGGNWTLGLSKPLLADVAANKYLYLTGGAAGTAAAYTAGRFLIEIWGV